MTFKLLEIASKNGVQSGSFTFGMLYRENGYYDIEGVDDCNSSVYQGCHCCIFIVDPRNVGFVFCDYYIRLNRLSTSNGMLLTFQVIFQSL